MRVPCARRPGLFGGVQPEIGAMEPGGQTRSLMIQANVRYFRYFTLHFGSVAETDVEERREMIAASQLWEQGAL